MNKKYLVLVGIAIIAFGYLVFNEYQNLANKPGVNEIVPSLAKLKTPDLYVNPNGNDDNDGRSSQKSLKTIQKAIDLAQPGEVIFLEKGIYPEKIISRQNGTPEKPITIEGSREAIVKGDKETIRIIEINHDYITLQGFTVDGLSGPPEDKNSYKDKLIYAIGKEDRDGVDGLKINGMEIKNAGGECIRLRYFTRKAEISNNVIRGCGAYDFKFDSGGKNGEGIYVGTAPEQIKDGKNETKDRDESNENWIHNNFIDTQGNECIDIKEGSSGNLVENNLCTGQKDPQSAGMDARGSNNIFRKNEVFGNVGAGIRLGGDKEKDGIDNIVVENVIKNNEAGGVKLEQFPQGEICRNTFLDNGKGDFVGEFTNEEELKSVREKCK